MMAGAGSSGERNVAPRRFSLARRAFFRSVEWICKVAGGRAFYYYFFLRERRLRVREEAVFVKNLDPKFEGFTIAQLTDFHGGSFLRAADLAGVVNRTNRIAPDLIALTGDFLTHVTEEALELAPAFAPLRAARGIFAVFGNHDYRGRREGEIAAALLQNGVRVLRNSYCKIDDGLFVAGVEDLEEGKYPDFQKALGAIPANSTVILLCHHPAGLEFAASRGVSVVLSGHTHGNQVRWPVLRNLGPTHPGDRMESGNATLIVSHGIGVIGVPFRAGTRAEIVIIRLFNKSGQNH